MKRPSGFLAWLHSLFAWNLWSQPRCDRVDLPRPRRRVEVSVPFQWPEPLRSQTLTEGRVWKVTNDGRGRGTPIQVGAPGRSRSITWGGGYGKVEQNRAVIPKPRGDYWITGHPSPQYDRRCIVADPDNLEHVELIQFDQDAPELPAGFPQQALGYGRWRGTQLLAGRATTATGNPVGPFVWTPWSHLDLHEQALVLTDYRGADGLMGDDWPQAGDRFVLDTDSPSFQRMVALGGECAARARALAVYGAVLIDRAGWEGVEPDEIGEEPRPPSLHVQAGVDWKGTNLHLWAVDLVDLRRVLG